MPKKNVGKGTRINITAKLSHHKRISIGKKSLIGAYCNINPGTGNIVIGDKVLLAPQVTIVGSNHDVSKAELRHTSAEKKNVVVEDGAWIATGAIVLPGVRIGKGAIVGAGAVVTKNVPPMIIVGGIPAKVIRKREIRE